MDQIIKTDTHRDPGPICLSLLADLRTDQHAVSALRKATSRRIEHKVRSGVGQRFEEGPVLLQVSTRPSMQSHACLYQMDFDRGNCARMHNHPLGERILVIAAESNFRIWSATEFDVDPDLLPMSRLLAPSTCPETGIRSFGHEISAGVVFTVQIPPGTSHRFLGDASAISIHPNETQELENGGLGMSSMSRQTAFWTRTPPSDAECAPPPKP